MWVVKLVCCCLRKTSHRVSICNNCNENKMWSNNLNLALDLFCNTELYMNSHPLLSTLTYLQSTCTLVFHICKNKQKHNLEQLIVMKTMLVQLPGVNHYRLTRYNVASLAWAELGLCQRMTTTLGSREEAAYQETPPIQSSDLVLQVQRWWMTAMIGADGFQQDQV